MSIHPDSQQFLDGRVTLYCGDCLEVLDSLPENSVDSVVTDPPYHLTSIVKRFGGDMPPRTEATVGKHAYGRHAAGFMGKAWDGGDIAFQVDTWRKVLRVLKPGGYILAFASTRGFGRMSVAIEDSGFITHPLIAWVFGAGMPKATRIKACALDGPFAGIDVDGFRYGGQALKPAIEPIYMGQKPFSEANGTANILKYGTGAVNIEACKVHADDALGGDYTVKRLKPGATLNKTGGNWRPEDGPEFHGSLTPGRWPANLIHDGSDEVLAAFPANCKAGGNTGPGFNSGKTNDVYGNFADRSNHGSYHDDGSAARFFYSAKADAEDRIGSKHPTVKPLDLKQYLCRLITPPGGTVLDLFAGTGTTGEAAWREGFNAILIEREAEYQADIARRMDLAVKPTKRAAVAKSKNKLMGAEGTPLFGGEAA